MPEALARIRREPTLSAPAREAARPTPRAASPTPSKAIRSRKWRVWMPRSLGGYVGVFMAVALAGIVVNAVGLQHERHPAPLFAPEVAAPPASAPATSVTPAPSASAPKAEAAPPPAVKPNPAIVPPSHKTDPIGDWIRTGSPSDAAKAVVGAQRALIKLGYDLQADGLMGSTTIEALHNFEKSHGLPVTNELSPRLIAKLNGAGR